MDINIDIGIKKLQRPHHDLLSSIDQLSNFKSGTEAERLELAESIQVRLKEYEVDVQALELEIESEKPGVDRQNHEVALDELSENLRLAKTRFKRAQVQSQKNKAASLKEQRQRLFQGAQNVDDKEKERNMYKSTEERAVGKSADITQTLRRVHQMATTEVAKSQLNVEELEYSTKQLSQLDERYSAVTVLLAGSKKLVRHLEQADKKDRQYMIMALSFLGATFAWIVWRRILKMPVMLLLWTLAKVLGLAKFFGRAASSLAPEYYETVATDLAIAATETATETTTETATSIIDTIIETMHQEL